MTAPARLLSVRLQGFKSFAERTHVAFGPGISAVVGPNGSGKSNLADALRWALGEQGRALRTRKAEDVVWAGSERRPALGMADVQLILDNADGLLPVEFGVVELGRRLYRSGENEYVLNRQRVRLRDLVDLLDTAHLAENAFLFIGQGMVDQALALRPEERRPLFEEVAGVRRHERRRRRAEEQLAESEANLARVEDIVGELRPQVRRLAAQAEQQANRRDAGHDLATALLVAAHGRWHGAAARLAVADAGLAGRRDAIDATMRALAEREAAAAGVADRLAGRAAAAADARRDADAARDVVTTARLAAAAAHQEESALVRELERLAADRVAVDAALTTDRRAAALAPAAIDPTLDSDLRAADASLAAAETELATARSANQTVDADRAAAGRTEAARTADLDLARRRRDDLRQQADAEAARAAIAEQARAEADAAHALAAERLSTTSADQARAREAEAAAVAAAAAARDAASVAAERAAGAGARAAASRARLDALDARVAAAEADELARAAISAGGRRVTDGLTLDPAAAAAVGAALGAAAAGVLVGRSAVAGLSGRHGRVAVHEAIQQLAPRDEGVERLRTAVRVAGGGILADAVRDDPTGTARRLLARAVWLPDLAACLALQALLPAGWVAVPRDGGAIVGDVVVELGPDAGLVALRVEAESLGLDVSRADDAANDAEAERAGRGADERAARERVAAAREALVRAADRRREAEVAETAASRRAETAAREAAWQTAQADRLRAAATRAAEELAALEPAAEPAATSAAEPTAEPGTSVGGSTASSRLLADRVAELRARRERLATAWRTADAARRDADRDRARAEASVALGERRLVEIEAAVAGLAARGGELERARAAAERQLGSASQASTTAVARLETLLAEDVEDRARLGDAERATAAAREALREVQDAVRGAEREELEARLGLDALREQLLVELAGLGDLGLRHLMAERRDEPVRPPAGAESGADGDSASDGIADDASADVTRLERALDGAAPRWASEPPAVEVPTPGRLASLRRRFHELGAANPYAVEEHAALAARLQSLESQRADLLAAVARTRELIAELDGLIATQFRTTFGALERAFDARFRQLFGGGFARLALTEPADLAATGIEITARPPGKKPQALAMLSGGERALTAVALLFAMLEIRPVPFCVLDEVDAALDEANIGRFTDALRELASQTQFIVITHNRGTIEIADALYGVTVGDDSVSRVISLRLEDATAIVDAAVAGRRREPIIPAGLTDKAADEPADEAAVGEA
jgi:chromosome segregation protein